MQFECSLLPCSLSREYTISLENAALEGTGAWVDMCSGRDRERKPLETMYAVCSWEVNTSQVLVHIFMQRRELFVELY